MESLSLKDIGLAVAIIFAAGYLMYMVGLILVLRRLGRLSWLAFIPIVNYYAQVRAVNAPASWFWLSLIPYVGAIYAGSVAIRLGHIFGRRPRFSLFWLIFGCSVGMFVIAFSKQPINEELLNSDIHLIEVKRIKKAKQATGTESLE